MPIDTLAIGLMWYTVFLLSTTCHEAAHAYAAKRGGDLTAFHGGQVTLNPLPHIKRERVGMVIVPLLSFLAGGWMMGWASAPYDVDWSRRHPHRAATMALAGPLANFALAAIAALGIHLGLWTGLFRLPDSVGFTHIAEAAAPGIAEGLAQLLGLFFSLNVLLGCFNLLPIPPLDGFSVICLPLNEERARRLQDIGRSMKNFAYVGVILGWRLFDGLYDPLFIASVRVLYPTVHYRF